MGIGFNKWMVLSAAALLVGAVACGDETSGTTSTTSSTGGSGGVDGTGGSASNTGGSTSGPTCEEACSVLYDCGAADNNTLCPGFAQIPKADYVGPCNDACETDPAAAALKGLAKPGADCASLIGTVKTVNGDFKNACENGPSGGGGAGGTGGSGGSGGG